MEERYTHATVESKWQRIWREAGLYVTPQHVEGKKNYYQLVEFPYPSGNLHVGHWYAFCGPDIHARYKRMCGYNVLFPIGFDAFGLPAENAAIKHNLNPADWTRDNIAHMRTQIASMGTSFDPSREVVTCEPEYYKHTQWLFIQLFNAGLVERATTAANWCTSCKTVLANEQVVQGACERCDTPVEKKEMAQWQIKITRYADRLIDDLETVEYPAEIVTSQRNWIGRSEGAEIDFPISPVGETVTIFTTRPDTLFGATYMVMAPEHPQVMQWLQAGHIDNADAVRAYGEAARKKSEIERTAQGKEKTGVRLDGITATNPATGEKLPVYVADYVLAHYGTGAIMAVPAHDERDFAFAQAQELPIRRVICADGEDDTAPLQAAYTGTGRLVNSGSFTGMESTEARRAITQHVGGRMTTTYKLRDWTVSRQRYWGCPIPLVRCSQCGYSAVPEEQLPVTLPPVTDYLPSDDGRSPLAKNKEFVRTTCPKCKGPAERETDTMDTFVDSSWYFLRYTDAHNAERFAAPDALNAWMPVDFYSGGAEHTTMHLLYSRFFHKALYDLGLVKEREPYAKRLNRGLIMGPDGNKMSKSKGNVIDPDDIVRQLGADTLRLYLAFIGPYNEVGNYPWNPQSIIGVRRFVERVWRIQNRVRDDVPEERVETLLHRTLANVTQSIEEFKLNTGVAALMSCLTAMEKAPYITAGQLRIFVQMLAPYAPHIAEELWHAHGGTGSVHESTWPTVDADRLVEEEVTIAVQINGKVRAEITIPREADNDTVVRTAQEHERVQKHLDGLTVQKTIYVPGRLVNIVAR